MNPHQLWPPILPQENQSLHLYSLPICLLCKDTPEHNKYLYLRFLLAFCTTRSSLEVFLVLKALHIHSCLAWLHCIIYFVVDVALRFCCWLVNTHKYGTWHEGRYATYDIPCRRTSIAYTGVCNDGIASLVGTTVVFTVIAPESRAMIFVRELESRILAGSPHANHLVVLNTGPALRKFTILAQGWYTQKGTPPWALGFPLIGGGSY